MPESWKKAAHFFDLPDFLTWKATGSLNRLLMHIFSFQPSSVSFYLEYVFFLLTGRRVRSSASGRTCLVLVVPQQKAGKKISLMASD